IVDDDLASVLEFVETIYKENVATTISYKQKKEQGLIQEISAGDSQDDAFPSTQDHDSISPEYATEILLTSDDLPKTDVGEKTLPTIE
ncbi:8487_t:CDS:2, partial [Racocetra fulgida]